METKEENKAKKMDTVAPPRPTRKPRRKPKKNSKPVPPEETPKEKLKAKIRALSAFRIPKAVREERMDLLEERISETKSKREKERLKKELEILETVAEKEENFGGEFPDYGDSASYGGGQERPD